jgi:hypothetical protein
MSKVSTTVFVGCLLPSGIDFPLVEKKGEANFTKNRLRLKGPEQDEEFDVKFRGIPKNERNPVLERQHIGITEVDSNLWEKVKYLYGDDYVLFKNGTIFDAKSKKELLAKFKDLQTKKGLLTGFEPMSKPHGNEGEIEKLTEQRYTTERLIVTL